jgi:hypothetical protein
VGIAGQADVKALLSADFERSPHLIGNFIARFYGNAEFVDSETPKSLARLYPLMELRAIVEKYGVNAWAIPSEQKAIELFLERTSGIDSK